MECPRCSGTGKCTECKGSGTVACGSCGGSGVTDDGKKCIECYGEGSFPCQKECEVCGGSGTITFEKPAPQEKKTTTVYVTFEPKKPKYTIGIIAATVLITFLSGQIWESPNLLFALGCFTPQSIHNLEIWRFVTSIFLHAGALHLVLNMWCLYVLAPIIEQIIGGKKFLILYIISGIAGNLMSVIFLPEAYSVGASGAVFGVMTAYFALYLKFKMFDKAIIGQLLFWFVVNMLFGVMQPQINIWAHLGGGIFGFAYIYSMRSLK